MVRKSDVANLGTDADFNTREENERVDSTSRQNKIEKVRKWLYQKGTSITSKAVKKILALGSLTPSRVCILFPLTAETHSVFLERFFHQVALGGIQLLQDVCRRRHARVRARRVEVHLYPSHAHPTRARRRQDSGIQ